MYDTNARKKNTTVSINSDLLTRAKALGLNLSGTLETRLAELVAEHERERWRQENADAIADYNDRIDACGTYSDGLPSF